MLGTLEDNCWWCLLDVSQKIKYRWDEGPQTADPPVVASRLVDGMTTPEQRDIVGIIKSSMFTMERIAFLLRLLKKYEPALAAHIEATHASPDIT